MPETRQVLFIQGGGPRVHDDWDARLVDSLQAALGASYEIRYPRMPGEDDPQYASWSSAIRREIAMLDDGAVVVGHSTGGTVLINALAEVSPERRLRAIMLIAAPFLGAGGWHSGEFQLPDDLAARLPRGTDVHLFHGLQDQTIPPEHVDRYASAIPHAQVRHLPGRDHQLNNDLGDVADAIRSAYPSAE